MAIDLVFIGEFLDTNGDGVTGLTVLVDVDAWARATGARTAIATAAAATEGRNGHYAYRVADCDLAANNYVVAFKTTSTTPAQKQVSCSTFLGADVLVSSRLAAEDYTTPPTAGTVATQVRSELATELGRVDATISSRLADADYTAPLDAAGVRGAVGLAAADLDDQLDALPTAAEAADAVWDEAAAGHTTSGTFGAWVAAVTSSLAAIVAAIAALPAAVWSFATRTLSSSAAETAAAVTGTALAITSRTSYSATISGLTISATWEKIWWTLKGDDADDDDESLAQIVVSRTPAAGDGLLYLNGAAGTLAQGSLTVDQTGGAVTIALADEASTLLRKRAGLVYDLKQLEAGDTTELRRGAASVSKAVTAAIA